MLKWLNRIFRRTPSLIEMIRMLFEGHGVTTRPIDEGFFIPGPGIVVQAEIFSENGPASQLDVRLILPDGQLLIESVGGFELVDLVDNFARSSFHVLLRALVKAGADEQVDVETWTVNGVEYRAYLGPVTHRGETQAAVPTDWFTLFESSIRNATLTGDLHWIRLYYAQMNNETMDVEVLLDNETWDELQTTMRAYDWSRRETFYSVRMFMILKRAAHA